MKVAVIGSGIAGLSCAYELSRHGAPFEVTLFEANDYFGGHSHTVDVTLDGITHGVDTGFLVFNRRTYPNLVELFRELQVQTAPADMTFSVMARGAGIEWGGRDLNTVFAQRRNLLRPAFLIMLRDIARFNRLATNLALAQRPEDLTPGRGIAPLHGAGPRGQCVADSVTDPATGTSVAAFLAAHGFSDAFRDWYLLPMIGAIWSCTVAQMMAFPMTTLVRFCHNHGLLQVVDRPQWYTVRGGAREYVRRMIAHIADARLGTPVESVIRTGRLDAPGVAVRCAGQLAWFDEVVFACHSDQALALLAAPSADETAVLGALRYAPNRAVLHTDAMLLPGKRSWSAWNYESHAIPPSGTLGFPVTPAPDKTGNPPADTIAAPGLCVHYLINHLQPLPFKQPVIVSLNPLTEPRAERVLRELHYSHPVFDSAAIAAQARVPALQGTLNTWFCGAWTGYGFHEDGLRSGLEVAARIKTLAGATPVARLVRHPVANQTDFRAAPPDDREAGVWGGRLP